MEKVQHFLQFLFPDCPCHETFWCSPQLLLGLCAEAAGSSVWPGAPLSWRREVAQGCIQEQLWEPEGQHWPHCKSPQETPASVLMLESLDLLSMFQPLIYHLQIYRGTEKRCAFMEKRKALQRSWLERPASWRWTFLGIEMGIQQTAHCMTTNLSPSPRFLVSLGF